MMMMTVMIMIILMTISTVAIIYVKKNVCVSVCLSDCLSVAAVTHRNTDLILWINFRIIVGCAVPNTIKICPGDRSVSPYI
jgi:hypothetical protein